MIIGRFATILTAVLERIVDVGGSAIKILAGVGLILLLAALVVGIIIAQPTLQEIGQDLRDDLQQNYRRHKWMRRYEQRGMW